MNKEEQDELFKKCFAKTLKKLAEEPDEVINYNELLKKYNNLFKEKIKQQQELERYKNIIDELEKILNILIEDNGISPNSKEDFKYILNKLKELKGSDE